MVYKLAAQGQIRQRHQEYTEAYVGSAKKHGCIDQVATSFEKQQ